MRFSRFRPNGSLPIAAATFVPFAQAGAQAVPIAECAAPCPLAVELAMTFGDDDGPGMLGDYVRGFPGEDGRWYLVDRPPTEVKVYDESGDFLHRFGRGGEGPGEFSLIRSVLPLEDGIVAVLDDPSGLKFFDAAGNLLREARLPFPPTSNGVVYADGLGMVIAANAPTPERTGLPLHVVDLDDGSVDLSFGSLTGEYRLSDVGGASRVLAEAAPGTVWAARLYEYRVELWTPDGLERSLVRDVPWFPATTLSTLAHGWAERPNTILSGVATSGSQMWVKLRVADEHWESASDENPATPDLDRFFDTIIEVIDLDESRVIGRVRLDEDYSNFVGPGMIGRTAVTPAGSVRYEVYRISTTTPGSGQVTTVPGFIIDRYSLIQIGIPDTAEERDHVPDTVHSARDSVAAVDCGPARTRETDHVVCRHSACSPGHRGASF